MKRATTPGGNRGGSNNQQGAQPDAKGSSLADVLVVLPRDPVAAAETLAAHLGRKTFAHRWLRAAMKALDGEL